VILILAQNKDLVQEFNLREFVGYVCAYSVCSEDMISLMMAVTLFYFQPLLPHYVHFF